MRLGVLIPAVILVLGTPCWAASASEESTSLKPIEPSLFRHLEPSRTKYCYRFERDGLTSVNGSWKALSSGGKCSSASASLVSPGFSAASQAAKYSWDLRLGWDTHTNLVLEPGRFSRIDLAPGDGFFFRAKSMGKELDNYPNRYVLWIVLSDSAGNIEQYSTDYFEVEGIWGTYYVPLDRFGDVTYGASGVFARTQPPRRLVQACIIPVTNKCRAAELLLDTFAVYTTGPPCEGDRDGDGIPDSMDGDDDNNGMADFAQAPDPLRFTLEGYVLYGGRWKGEFAIGRRTLDYGDTLQVDADLEIHSEIIADAAGAFPEFTAVLVGERVFDKGGRYRQFSDHMMSTLLTPTGLPIETIQPDIPTRHARSFSGIRSSSPIDIMSRAGKGDITVANGVTRMRFRFEQIIDYSVPEGNYRFQVQIGVVDNAGYLNRFEELPSIIRALQPVSKDVHFRKYIQPEESLVFVKKNYLPMVRIGSPAAPRLPWALIMDREVHGVRGIVPEEEKSEWGLNFRNRLGGRPIYPRGWYNFEPGLPSLAYERLNVHHRMNWRSGEVAVSVTDPDGLFYDLGKAGFLTATRWGASTRTGKFLFPCMKYGKYTVSMKGYLYDEYGNAFTGGGTYVFWVAERITFGTFPSQPYEVGQGFQGAVEVVPPVPAEMKITVEHYPYSDPARKDTFTVAGKALPYGLYAPDRTYVFKEPGEYFSHIEGTYTDPEGRLWMGSTYGACVAAPKDSLLLAHGRGYFMANGQVLRDDPRYADIGEGDLENNIEQYLFYPYHSGDVMYVASTMDFKNQIYPLLTMEFRDGLVPYGPSYSFDPKQTPIFSLHSRGWNSHCYPEGIEKTAYFYTDSWRPGVNGRHVVGDGLMMNTYWPTSPSILGNQNHVCQNGDLPGDFYKFTGGVVYRDLRSNVNRYAIYSSFGVVIPKGSNANRVVEFGKEPLFSLCGRDHYMFLGGGVLPVPGLCLIEGGRAPAGGACNPPVPATLDSEIESPSGKVHAFKLQANLIGIFPRGLEYTAPLTEPGIWKARHKLRYGGREGDVLGTGAGEYPLYVLPSDRSRIVDFSIESPPMFKIRPDEELRLHGVVPPEVVEGEIHYTTVSPGLIMDFGSRKLVSGRFVYKFFPKEMSYCYSFYDYMNYMSGKPELCDTVVITMFLEGKNGKGEKVFGTRMVVLRGETVMNFPPAR